MKKRYPLFVMLLMLCQCRDPFVLSLPVPEGGFLVAEGTINTSGVTLIRLSRTGAITGFSLPPETGATVTIEGENGNVYALHDTANNGSYISEPLLLDTSFGYRINIRSGGKEYASSFQRHVRTPPIDSLTWKRHFGGVEVFVNTHSDAQSVGYYKWDFEETYEIRMPYVSNIDIIESPPGVYKAVQVASKDHLRTCWRHSRSTTIKLGSTERLISNTIHLPLVSHAEGSVPMSRLYSIRVFQYALSKEAYEFYRKMQQNTENIGTIFDPQPSEIKGNLTCITDPAEQVVGFIETCTPTDSRLFISNAELPDWNYYHNCPFEELMPNDTDSIERKIVEGGFYPTNPYLTDQHLNITSFYYALTTCVDCTATGTNVKPSFWPQ